ncbi:MAG: homoserine dehydrogenase [Bryobacteraceae bacterium]
MTPIRIGVVGLGNVGMGALAILAENETALEQKLGFPLRVTAVCARTIEAKALPAAFSEARRTTEWRDVATSPDVDIVVELIGGTTVARDIVETSIANGKAVVTANKELMGLSGASLWRTAEAAGVPLAMEASVAGGIPIHTVLREGISGDRVTNLFGILNGTSNYILTEIERNGSAFDTVLAEAQKLGYAEADPTADVDGFDARSKLTILAALAFGAQVTPTDIFTEGIRRIMPIDFAYAHQLHHTIRLICAARETPAGVLLSVRPSLIPQSTILASVLGAYNAIWVKGAHGQDTFYYGRGAGSAPTGVAVVSDLMRVARDLKTGAGAGRVSPFAFSALEVYKPVPIETLESAYFLRFRVKDRPGIIAKLAQILADQGISLDAVLQLPAENWRDLPFVITIEPTSEASLRAALAEMAGADFLLEPPLALPMEKSL